MVASTYELCSLWQQNDERCTLWQFSRYHKVHHSPRPPKRQPRRQRVFLVHRAAFTRPDSYTIVAWISCSDFTLGDVSFLTAWMPSALALAAASVVM